MKRKHLALLVRVLVSSLLVGYFVRTLAHRHGGIISAWEKFISVFSHTNPLWLLAAAALMALGYNLLTLRWKILLTAQGHTAPYKRLLLYYFMSTFFNTFLPSTIGGDTLRVVKSRSDTSRGSMSLVVVVIERLSGLAALMIISAIGLLLDGPFRNSPNRIIFSVIVLLAALAILSAVLIHPRPSAYWLTPIQKRLPKRLRPRVHQVMAALWAFYRKPASLLGCLCISIVFQANMVVYYYCIARALGETPDIHSFIVHVPIMIFLLMTIPAINGLGVRTAGFQTLMRFPPAFALAAEFLDLGFRILVGMMGGVVFLFHRTHRPPKS